MSVFKSLGQYLNEFDLETLLLKTGLDSFGSLSFEQFLQVCFISCLPALLKLCTLFHGISGLAT